MGTGPREWAPREEPSKRTFDFGDLKVQVRRTGDINRNLDEESYEAIAIASDGVTYEHMAFLPTMARYEGRGLLEAAVSVLEQVRFVKEDFRLFRQHLKNSLWITPQEVDREAAQAKDASRSFSKKAIYKAMESIHEQLLQIPEVRREHEKRKERLLERLRRQDR